jgi:phage-related holin
MGELIGVDLSFTELFGWFTLATYMINELRSIIENLVEMDIKVPDILVKGLAVAEKITNDKAGEVIEKESEEEK